MRSVSSSTRGTGPPDGTGPGALPYAKVSWSVPLTSPVGTQPSGDLARQSKREPGTRQMARLLIHLGAPLLRAGPPVQQFKGLAWLESRWGF